ncbi:hypothetical protein CRE_05146 [Caenorhabditis remanei]|uniref:Uncharacterized protein n=1 Tax=Caenorhabditis remanei TaxID=31234 RepID=E3N6B4_CAERE|nr:hypothetical protein CRE_05146 [Caenorhabditis remanei]
MDEGWVSRNMYLISENNFSIVFSSFLLPNNSVPSFLLILYWTLVSTKVTVLLLKEIALAILITRIPTLWTLWSTHSPIPYHQWNSVLVVLLVLPFALWAIIGEILVAVLFGYLPILLTYTSTILGLGKEEIGTIYLNYSICGSTVVEALPLIYLLKKPKVFASSVAVIPLSSSGRF